MKIVLESTTKIVTLDDMPVRVWQGHTVPSGIPVVAFITRLMPEVTSGDPCLEAFDRELKNCAAPRVVVEQIPNRMKL